MADENLTADVQSEGHEVEWCSRGTAPIITAGSGTERVELANSAAHQIQVLLGDLLERCESVYIDDDDVVPRALVSRAHALALAATHLLSTDEDIEAIRHSEAEVRRG
ncbi:MAG: hypothetical protein ABI569_04475 [Casimicrobiaceae bacterium]